MSDHVYVRVSGFGLMVIPRAPFQFERLGPSDLPIRVSHADRCATLHRAGDVAALQSVADTQPGPARPSWLLETTAFTAEWPAGFTLHYDPSGPPGFYLLNGSGGMVFAQGPYPVSSVPPLDQMIAPGQRLIARGGSNHCAWVELGYEHEGRSWSQRIWVAPLQEQRALLITFQAPGETTEPASLALAPFVRSISTGESAA